jgi:hypothetical protein
MERLFIGTKEVQIMAKTSAPWKKRKGKKMRWKWRKKRRRRLKRQLRKRKS